MNPAATKLDHILDVLSQHRGRDNAISAPALEAATGIPERAIRRLLADALLDGTLDDREIPIVAEPGVNGGFFIAATIEEGQDYHDQTYDLGASLLRKARSIRRLWCQLGIRLRTKGERP